MNINQENWTFDESIQNRFSHIQNVTFGINLSEGIETGSFLDLSFLHELLIVISVCVEVNRNISTHVPKAAPANKHC